MSFRGKAVIVTGAATGIGKAIALQFGRERANVVVNTAHNQKGANETVREIVANGGSSIFVKGDISNKKCAEEVVKKTIKCYGKIDVLVNNAAIGVSKPLVETTEEEWDRVIKVNVKGAFLLCKYSIPEMTRNGGGVIINISSTWGIVAGYNAAAYCTSKSALINLTRSIALDYAKDNIRAIAVCPGSVDTPILREGISKSRDPISEKRMIIESHPIGRIGKPEEIADVVLWLSSANASFVTGSTVVADGGLSAKCSLEGKDRWPNM